MPLSNAKLILWASLRWSKVCSSWSETCSCSSCTISYGATYHIGVVLWCLVTTCAFDISNCIIVMNLSTCFESLHILHCIHFFLKRTHTHTHTHTHIISFAYYSKTNKNGVYRCGVQLPPCWQHLAPRPGNTEPCNPNLHSYIHTYIYIYILGAPTIVNTCY